MNDEDVINQVLRNIDWKKYRFGYVQQSGRKYFIIDDRRIDVTDKNDHIQFRFVAIVEIQRFLLDTRCELHHIETWLIRRISKELDNISKQKCGPLLAVFCREVLGSFEAFRESFDIPDPPEDED
jgi:hypothetical protein